MGLSGVQVLAGFPLGVCAAVSAVLILARLHFSELFIQPLLLKFVDAKSVPYAVAAILALFAFGFLPYASTCLLAFALPGGVDAANARLQRSRATGLASRFYNCHLNFIEGLVLYTSVLSCAAMAGVPLPVISRFATLYLFFRMCFVVFFAMNVPPLRTLTWLCGVVCCMMLFGYSVLPNFDARVQLATSRILFFADLAAPLGKMLSRK